MNIYSLVCNFANNYEPNYRHTKKLFKRQHPAEYNYIIETTYLTYNSTWAEIVYVVQNNITETPPCETCGKLTTWNKATRNGYYRFCAAPCAVHLANEAARAPSIKDKRKRTVKDRYGVSNPSQCAEVQETIRKKAKERWRAVYKNKKFTADGLTRLQYRNRCGQYADTQYRRNKDTLDPNGLRSKDWHVDHIYSVTDGFLNNVPINIISDISNLRLIPATDNYAKHRKSEKTLEQLYEDFYRTTAQGQQEH